MSRWYCDLCDLVVSDVDYYGGEPYHMAVNRHLEDEGHRVHPEQAAS